MKFLWLFIVVLIGCSTSPTEDGEQKQEQEQEQEVKGEVSTLQYLHNGEQYLEKCNGEKEEQVKWDDNTKGICHFLVKEYSKAIFYFNSSLQAPGPLQAPSANNIGVVHVHRGHYQRALNMFKKSIELAPKKLFPRRNLAHLYMIFDRQASVEKVLAPYKKQGEVRKILGYTKKDKP